MVKYRITSKLICISLMVVIIINTILPSFSNAKEFSMEYYANQNYIIDGEGTSLDEHVCQQIEAAFYTNDVEKINYIMQEYKYLFENLEKLLTELNDNGYNIDELSNESSVFLNELTSSTKYVNEMEVLFGLRGLNILSRLYYLKNPNLELPDNESIDDLKYFLNQLREELSESYFGNKERIELGIKANTIDDLKGIQNLGKKIAGNPIDGVLRYIAYPLKLLLLLPGLLGQAIMSLFKAGYGTDDGTDNNENGSQAWLTIDNILFNQLALTDINIFSENAYIISGTNAEIIENPIDKYNSLLAMRKSLANWYYAFRNLAIVLSLLMLIYIGIRIALTNLAEKKAEYTKMLVNWFTGFGLIFILHYIIIIVININNVVIQMLAKTNLNPDDSKYENLMNQLFKQSWWIDVTISWSSAILYVILVIITFIMLIMFIKRLITISILVVIAPLIGITYSIDKSGDNKSQIVDTWLKEFVYNVFIQIAYAASYLVFGRISMDLACTNIAGQYSHDFGATFLAVLSMLSMFLGVKIIKQIFGFDKASNLVEQLAMGTVISKTISNVTKGVKGTKGFIDNRAKLKQEQKEKEELKNIPQHTANGQSTAELLKQIKNEKEEEEFKNKMASREASTGRNMFTRMASKIRKRPLRNVPKIFSAPARMTKVILTKGLYLDELGNMASKINDRINGKQEVTVNAPEIFTALLNNYVKVSNKRSNTTMTAQQFEQNMERVKNANYNELTEEEGSLREIITGMNKRLGENQAQTIISHFMDEKWGTNGTNS